MTSSNYITFILLGVIGLVFLIDFILNSRKKPLEKSVEKFVEKEKSEGKSSLKWLNWILDRKKNLTLSILIISILKLLTHFYFYTTTISEAINNGYGLDRITNRIYKIAHEAVDEQMSQENFLNRLKYENTDFSFHLETIYSYELWLFIPATIVFLVVVWFFNDKIKAR